MVEGGGLEGKQWVVDTTVIEGREFVSLDKGDRKLARAMGRDMKSRNPWANNDLLARVAKLRDDAIDLLIAKERQASDPLADEGLQPSALKTARARYKYFDDGKIPRIIEISFPAFTKANGEPQPPVQLNVLSATKTGCMAAMELTPSNLELLRAASFALDNQQAARTSEEDLVSDRIELQQSHCKWRRRGSRCSIYCRYRNSEGEWRVHSEAPKDCDDPDAQLAIVREVEQRVEQFYVDNHVEPMIEE